MSAILSTIENLGEPRLKLVDVTPEIARQWLERNIGNRPITPAIVNRYARDMAEGRWKMAGDPIRFSRTGKLIDGQHRLSAILKTGVAVQCLVVTDLDDSIFNVIDTGRGRSKADVIYIEHGLPVETSKLLSTTAMVAYHYSHQLFSFRNSVTNDELAEFVRSNSGLINAAQYVKDNVPHESPAPKSIVAAFYFYAAALDEARAQRFVERFMVGAVNDANDNLLHLRNTCFNARANRRSMKVPELFPRLIKIWNAERRGKPIKHFGNTAFRQDETFPQFI